MDTGVSPGLQIRGRSLILAAVSSILTRSRYFLLRKRNFLSDRTVKRQ